MRRRNKTHDIDPGIEDPGNLPDHLLQGHFVRTVIQTVVADLMVLAVDALQVAMGKEDVADALRTADDRLFATVSIDGGNAESGSGLAVSPVFSEAVCMTASRTEGTIVQDFEF